MLFPHYILIVTIPEFVCIISCFTISFPFRSLNVIFR
jgi:hypothetical protein